MKVLAVSTNRGDPSPYLGDESARVQELQQAGTVTGFWLKADYSGAVMLLDSPDESAARAVVDTLPLVRHGITSFSLTGVVDPPVPA